MQDIINQAFSLNDLSQLILAYPVLSGLIVYIIGIPVLGIPIVRASNKLLWNEMELKHLDNCTLCQALMGLIVIAYPVMSIFVTCTLIVMGCGLGLARLGRRI